MLKEVTPINRYYIDPHCVIVTGKPSAALAEKLEKNEVTRIKAQVEKLGLEGLKAAETDLQKAKLEHERPIPTDILTSFIVPDVKTISWIPVQSHLENGLGRGPSPSTSDDSLSKHVLEDGSPLPFFVQYNHVQV